MTQPNSVTCSRRGFVLGWAVALAQTRAAGDSGHESPAKAVSLTLVRKYKYASLAAMSPNGKRMLLYMTKQPIESFRFQGGTWTHKDAGRESDSLQLVELGTWEAMQLGGVPARVYCASFFAEGDRLHIQTGLFAKDRKLYEMWAVVDVQTGKRQERLLPWKRGDPTLMVEAVSGPTLMTNEFWGGLRRGDLLQLELPEYRKVARVPYSPPNIVSGGVQVGYFFSADRKLVAYVSGNAIICRRTADLDVVWVRQFEPEFGSVRRMDVSADGRYVVAGFEDNAHMQTKFATSVYRGKDGAELVRWPLQATEGVGISPDGQFLAVGALEYPKKGETQTTVHIHKVATGRRLASGSHDTVKIRQRHSSLLSGFANRGIVFTSDGRYLITSSSRVTNVWRLQP